MENINEDCLDLPYGCTSGIARRTAVSGGEPHDLQRLRGHLNAALGYPLTNLVVKRYDECYSAFKMPTSFKMLPASGYVGNSFTLLTLNYIALSMYTLRSRSIVRMMHRVGQSKIANYGYRKAEWASDRDVNYKEA